MAEVKLLYLDATTGFPTQIDPTADSITLNGLTMSGDIVMGSQKITGLADGVSAQDAVTRAQLDAVQIGISVKKRVEVATNAALPAYTQAGAGVGATLTADAVGVLTIDGVATSLGDRVLIKDEAGSHADHGVYDVTTEGTAGVAFVLTRSTDFDDSPDGEVASGSFIFVDNGTANAKTGWALATADPIIVDTTAIAFEQFQGLTAYTYAAGLLDTSSAISVELDTAADAQGAGADGGSSGLEFDTTGAAGKLRARVSTTGGINRLADGLGLELNGTTLQVGATGVSVLGLPSLFEINGSAVSANVTQANLDELTGGGTTTLHSHAGVSEAERVENAYTTDGVGVTIGDPVYVSANNIVTSINANNDVTRKYIGVAASTVGASSSVNVISAGVALGAIAGATAGDFYYAAVGGGLTATKPSSAGDHIMVIGKAKNATDLHISPDYLGKL